MQFERQHLSDSHVIGRRTAPFTELLDNKGAFYFANLSVGTPPQNIQLLLDTGSSDMWINARSSPLCRPTAPTAPCDGGTYDANSSTTYRYIDSDFDITYAPQNYGRGDHASDTVHFGGKVLTGAEFGIGYDSTSRKGILGTGYPSDEAPLHMDPRLSKPFSNLPQLMVDQGLIRTKAYSLWLDDRMSGTGSILFGGVDTKKYHGSLRAVPIEKVRGQYLIFMVNMTGLGISGSGGSKSFHSDLPYQAWLDSGAPFTLLPENLAHEVYSAFGVDPSRNVDCNLANSGQSLDFSFGPVKISVPMHELVKPWDPKSPATNCEFGIGSSSILLGGIGSGSILLGDTFLRSAYLVFDMTHNMIAMAQTNLDATDSHIVEIVR
ncbi:MAG: hypothetical protein Q9218_000859 [Villophora microphyllina]